MILLMLPGTTVTYSGEELGVENTLVSWDPALLEYSSESHAGESSFYQTVDRATSSNSSGKSAYFLSENISATDKLFRDFFRDGTGTLHTLPYG
jgi:hypothetical protein